MQAHRKRPPLRRYPRGTRLSAYGQARRAEEPKLRPPAWLPPETRPRPRSSAPVTVKLLSDGRSGRSCDRSRATIGRFSAAANRPI